MSSKGLHVLHQQRYRERKQAGFKAVASAWQWLPQARLLELSKEAYKAASWTCRAADVHPAMFVQELGRQLHMRLAAEALAVGLDGCPTEYLHLRAQLEAALPDLPGDWRPQYPRFAAPQVGEASSHSDQVNTGAAKLELVNDGAARREVTPGPS